MADFFYRVGRLTFMLAHPVDTFRFKLWMSNEDYARDLVKKVVG